MTVTDLDKYISLKKDEKDLIIEVSHYYIFY